MSLGLKYHWSQKGFTIPVQIERERLRVWQIDVASHIVNQVDASVLTALPEFIGN